MQKEIIAAIAAYLEKNTDHIWHSQGERMAFKKPCEYPVFSEKKFCQLIAAEIAAAIAPIVNHVCPDCNGSGGVEIGEHEYSVCPCVNQSIAPEE